MAEKNESPAEGISRWKASKDGEKTERAEKCVSKKAAKGKTKPKAKPRRKLSHDAGKQVAALACAAVLVVASAVAAWLYVPSSGWGIDTAGGTTTTFSLDGEADAGAVAGLLERRLARAGVAGARVAVADGQLTVSVPAGTDASAAVAEAAKPNHLELVRLDSLTDAEALAKISSGASGVALEPGTYTALADSSEVTSAQVVQTSKTSETYNLAVSLNSDAAQRFSDATAELAPVRGQIAVVVDGAVVSAPSVSQQIDGGQVSISGGFSATEAVALAASLETGALPASLTQVGTGTAEPAVNAQAFQTGALWVGVAVLVMLVVCAVAFRLSALPILAGTVATYAFALAAVSVLASRRMLELTQEAIFWGALFAVLTVVWLGFVMSVVQRRVVAGKPVRDALSRLRDWMLTPLLWLAIMLAGSLGYRFVLSSGDEITVVALAFALSVLLALLLVTLPLLRLAATGPMARNPHAWGLPVTAPAGAAKAADAPGSSAGKGRR